MPWTPPKYIRHKEAVCECTEETLTEQHHKESCDMHHIMRRFRETGTLAHVNQYQGTYMDMPDGETFHDAMNTIAQANTMFETVPSHIRNEFHNDPARYLEFMQNPANREAIIEMGLDATHLPTGAPPAPADKPTPPVDAPPPEPPPEPSKGE